MRKGLKPIHSMGLNLKRTNNAKPITDSAWMSQGRASLRSLDNSIKNILQGLTSKLTLEDSIQLETLLVLLKSLKWKSLMVQRLYAS